MAQATRTNWRNLATIISVLILIGTEVFGIAFAGAWAIAGLFELGDTMQYALMVLFGAIGAWTMVKLWQNCVAVEPIKA